MSEPNPLADLSRATSAAVAAAARYVVAVRDAQGRQLSGIIWENGRIVSAEECLGSDDPAEVVLPDGRELPSEITGRDPTTDVVLLKAETADAASPEPAEMPDVGALTLVIGRGETGPMALLAIVAATGPTWTSSSGGKIDGLVRLGIVLPYALEGGAVVDAAGRLVGMAVADPGRRGLVIPSSTIARSVETLASRGHVGRGYLGLSLRPLGAAPGLMVVEVSESGPAAESGFLLGDIVTSWNGEPVGSMRGISRRLGPDTVGSEVRLGIVRAGEPREVRVTIGERRRGEG